LNLCQAYDIYDNFNYESSGKLNDFVENGVHVLSQEKYCCGS